MAERIDQPAHRPNLMTASIPHPDQHGYFRYTKPQRLHKAINTLVGLLKGVAADKVITPEETNAIRNWVNEQRDVKHLHPFNEIIASLNEALADNVLELEEIDDVLWLCDKLSKKNPFFNVVTSDMQRLQGILAGIASDGTVTQNELGHLRGWMDAHDHLRSCWPYDEIDSLLTGVLEDGVIDPDEHDMLMTFFLEFLSFGEHRAVELKEDDLPIKVAGLCAVCPNISFTGKTFCLTGSSDRGMRKDLVQIVERLGGKCKKGVSGKVDYLIIGAAGNSTWAYACYGRKVEKAVELRKAGSCLLIVHENDFWDAAQDHELDP